MKFSVKAIVMMFAMVLTVAFANAQPKGGKKGKSLEERTAKETARLQKNLGLNEAQTKEISAINLAYAQKTKSIRDASRAEKDAGNDVDKGEVREQLKSLREAQNKEVKSILTPEQLTKFDTMLEERQAKKDKKGKKGKKAKKGKKGKKAKSKKTPNEEGEEEGEGEH